MAQNNFATCCLKQQQAGWTTTGGLEAAKRKDGWTQTEQGPLDLMESVKDAADVVFSFA